MEIFIGKALYLVSLPIYPISEGIFTINHLLSNFNMKFVFVLFPLLLAISCNRNPNKCKSEPEFVYMKLNNKDIESAIIEYQQKLEKSHERFLNKGDSVYVGVYMKNINDSIQRYVLHPIIDYDFLEFETPFVICYVSGKIVFFNSEH